jgi:hypothetical protein
VIYTENKPNANYAKTFGRKTKENAIKVLRSIMYRFIHIGNVVA